MALYVVRLGSKEEGSSKRHETVLLERRQSRGSGHVVLMQPGRHIASLDNTYSLLRSKQVREA